MRILLAAIAEYQSIPGSTPTALADLVTKPGALLDCSVDFVPGSGTYRERLNWCGPYVDQMFDDAPDDYKTDSWGTEFDYDTGGLKLSSCGPNTTCGDADDIIFSF